MPTRVARYTNISVLQWYQTFWFDMIQFSSNGSIKWKFGQFDEMHSVCSDLSHNAWSLIDTWKMQLTIRELAIRHTFVAILQWYLSFPCCICWALGEFLPVRLASKIVLSGYFETKKSLMTALYQYHDTVWYQCHLKILSVSCNTNAYHKVHKHAEMFLSLQWKQSDMAAKWRAVLVNHISRQHV